jgi:energy-coupling factor transport system ATP-binding protein
VIKVENLDYSYTQEDHALKDVSFEINDGEWVSIVGHNGSGKSTLSKLLVGLLAADKGSIYYDDEKLSEENVESLRQQVGIVFQNPDNQFVGVNVKYDMAFGLENRNVERNEMLKLIEEYSKKVDMYDYLDRAPETLSGGQKQRVAIAGILALNCKYIILDEATSMLDPEGVAEITKLIVELKEKYHKTIITITHDLDLAALSDRVIVMKSGKIIGMGTPKEIFDSVDVLRSSNLDIPFNLKLYKDVKNDPVLSKNERLVEALWKLNF